MIGDGEVVTIEPIIDEGFGVVDLPRDTDVPPREKSFCNRVYVSCTTHRMTTHSTPVRPRKKKRSLFPREVFMTGD